MRSSKAVAIFWKKALGLGLLVLGVALWAEARLRQMPTLYHLKRDGLAAAAPRAQLLVLGASQANEGLDPSQWPVPAYNAACVGQDAYYDCEMFKAWLPRLPALKTVVLPISYVSFDSSLANTAETWRCFAYSQSFGIPNEMPAQRWDLRNWSALALVEPWPALKLAMAGFVDPNAVSLTAQGFEAMDPVSEDLLDFRMNALTAGKRLRYHQSISKEGELALNLGYYKAILDLAQGRGLRIVFVVFPVDASYAQAVSAADLQRRAGLLKGLVEGRRASVVDYFKDKRFESRDFADVDHLNVNGAKKFSQLLWKEALKD
jgi:hypothetical protein